MPRSWLLDDGAPRVTTLDLGGAVLGPTALAALARAPNDAARAPIRAAIAAYEAGRIYR